MAAMSASVSSSIESRTMPLGIPDKGSAAEGSFSRSLNSYPFDLAMAPLSDGISPLSRRVRE